jgi:hypothetical protein
VETGLLPSAHSLVLETSVLVPLSQDTYLRVFTQLPTSFLVAQIWPRLAHVLTVLSLSGGVDHAIHIYFQNRTVNKPLGKKGKFIKPFSKAKFGWWEHFATKVDLHFWSKTKIVLFLYPILPISRKSVFTSQRAYSDRIPIFSQRNHPKIGKGYLKYFQICPYTKMLDLLTTFRMASSFILYDQWNHCFCFSTEY